MELNDAQRNLISRALDTVPFAKLLGINLETAESGQVTLALEVRDDLKRNNGVVHGGAVASLIDTATAFAIISILPAGEQTTTVDLTVSYLRPLKDGKARATAEVLRAGRRLIVVKADVFDDNKTLIATALSTYIRM